MRATIDPRRFDRDFAPTNLPRTVRTDYLLSAGQAIGVQRFVAKSNGADARTGGAVKGEGDPFDSTSGREMRAMVAEIRRLPEAVPGADWTEGCRAGADVARQEADAGAALDRSAARRDMSAP